MRQAHIGGDKLFVDYAGDTVPVIVDRLTGQVRPAQIFVAVIIMTTTRRTANCRIYYRAALARLQRLELEATTPKVKSSPADWFVYLQTGRPVHAEGQVDRTKRSSSPNPSSKD
jgi:hypothetical protein